MKLLTTILALLFSSLALMSQTTNPNYDAELAKKLGSDDYGMKQYIFVLLKTGSNLSTDQTVRDSCFNGHMDNISRLVKESKLIVAGPMLEKNAETYRGIFILNVETVEEANILLQTDPAINAKYLEAVLYPWYGSAALSEYLKESDKIWKIGF